MPTDTALEYFEFTSAGEYFREPISSIHSVTNVYEQTFLLKIIGERHLIPHVISTGLGITGRYHSKGGSILLPTAAVVNANGIEQSLDGNLYVVKFDPTRGGRESATPQFNLSRILQDVESQQIQ